MNEYAKVTLALFNNGLNCAQTVLSVFSEKYGLNKEDAYRIAGGLGTGVRCGEVCGAVSGAVLVIGLKYGQRSFDDQKAKAECYAKTDEFIRAFRIAEGSIICRDILGLDPSTPEGSALAKQKNLYATVCLEKIKSAVNLLEELGY